MAYSSERCTSGVSKVNIEDSTKNVSSLQPAVPFIEADGDMIYPKDDGSFSIKAATQKLTIYSYVFNYSLINPEVSYQLQGFDKTAATVTRNNKANPKIVKIVRPILFFFLLFLCSFSVSTINAPSSKHCYIFCTFFSKRLLFRRLLNQKGLQFCKIN